MFGQAAHRAQQVFGPRSGGTRRAGQPVRLFPDRQPRGRYAHGIGIEGQGFLAAAIRIDGNPAGIVRQFMGDQFTPQDVAQGLNLGPRHDVQDQPVALSAGRQG